VYDDGLLARMARSVMVVAGVMVRDGLLLIGQRQAHDRHALKWEFPGGKVEPGETPRQALERELREELGIDAHAGEELARYEQRSRSRLPLLLIFLRVASFRGEPRTDAFEQIRWVPPGQLHEYDFLDGDLDFVHRLARGRVRL
jgi:8-oxo-dGTP diphosphatase